MCQMYQTPGTMFFTLHWQKVTHHGCDLSSSNSKKRRKKRTSFVQMLTESFTNIHSQVLTFYHHNTPLLNCLTHVQRLGGMPSMGSFIVGLVHIGVVVAKDTPKLGDPDSSVGLDVVLPPSVGKSCSSSSVHQYLLT